jgi:hypothetical protein
MEAEITLETLIAWHQQRAADCMATMARATHTPKREHEALLAMAQFHEAAVRVLQSWRVLSRCDLRHC